MKKLLSILMLSSLIVFNLNAQTKAEKEVEIAVESLKSAMISGNRSHLSAIAADELLYGHSGGKVEDKAAFVEAIASGKSDFVSIDLSEQVVKVIGKTAVVRHKLAAQTNDSGKPGSVNLIIMLTFVKQKGDWKLLGRQAVRLPQ